MTVAEVYLVLYKLISQCIVMFRAFWNFWPLWWLV